MALHKEHDKQSEARQLARSFLKTDGPGLMTLEEGCRGIQTMVVHLSQLSNMSLQWLCALI